MADDRLKVAIEIVAHDVVARAVREDGEMWGLYPEIGEHDWDRVMDRALELAPQVDPEQYKAAYEFLEERAENDE